MFNAQYWKDKEERKKLKEESDKPNVNKAIQFLKRFFGAGKPKPKAINVVNHTRPHKERLIRQQKHQTKMRSLDNH
jgi:hypothetical protein